MTTATLQWTLIDLSVSVLEGRPKSPNRVSDPEDPQPQAWLQM